MKESQFWTGHVKPMLDGMVTYRLENGVAVGMPDVHVFQNGKQAWLELKVMKGQRIEVRFSQFKWLYQRGTRGLADTYIVALHGDLIKVWRGETIRNFKTADSRETNDSFVFVPPAPDLTMAVGGLDSRFRSFIFSH